MNTQLFYIFLYVLVLNVSQAVVAQEISSEQLAIIEKIETCDEDARNCVQLNDIEIQTVREIQSDTLAAHYLRMVGHHRESAGLWDSLAESLHLESIQRLEAADATCKLVMSHFSYTRFALFQGDAEVTLERAERAHEVALECGEQKHIAHALSYLGAAHIEKSEYFKALEWLNESERLYTEIGDQLGLAMVLQDKSMVFSELKQDERSMEMLREAIPIYKAAGKDMQFATTTIDLVSGYLDLGMPDSAFKLLPPCEEIISGRHRLAQAHLLRNYGRAHLIQEDFPKAQARFEEALDIFMELGSAVSLSITNAYLSEVELEQGHVNKAYRYALVSDSIASHFGQSVTRLGSLRALAESAYSTGQFERSKQAFSDYIALNDSVRGAEVRQQITHLQAAFEAEKKENKIRAQEQEYALLEEKNRAANNRNIGLSLLAALLIALAYVLINRQRLKVQAKEAQLKVTELEKDKLSQSLAFKNRELSSKALQIAQKNELLQRLQSDLEEMASARGAQECVREVVNTLKLEMVMDENWDEFIKQFTQTNPRFYKNLTDRYPKLTKNEVRLAALLRMNLGSKDIARTLSISDEGVKKARYRLRKKMELPTADSLETHVMSI